MRQPGQSSPESVNTWAFELAASRSLTVLAAVGHTALGGVLTAHWGPIPSLPAWFVLGLTFAYALRRLLIPGQGAMPQRIIVASDGEWRLDADRGYLAAAWVTPWLCRVVISRTAGGRRYLWLARDAMGETDHWRLRRYLQQLENQR